MFIMSKRQSISLTDLNDEWLECQIANGEFATKNEALNYLVRCERRREEERQSIRKELIAAEKSGFTASNMDDIRNEARRELNLDG